jgi:hypothetical protein
MDTEQLIDTFYEHEGENHQCKALMIVQVLNGSFRFQIRSREMTVAASDCVETTREFTIPEQLLHKFSSALINCGLLHSIYPPFERQIEIAMRQQLELHIEPYTRGLFRRFKELANKFQKTTELVSDDSSISSVEHHAIDDDGNFADKPTAEKKGGKSVLGRVLGRLRSPLSKLT